MADEIVEVAGFSGYGVDRNGHVWSKWSRGARASIRDTWQRKLRPKRQPSGHLLVALVTGSGYSMQLVHRLVLEAFVGPCPVGLQCCHKDGNPENNRVENLRWDTPRANALDALEHGQLPQARLTREQVCGIKSMRHAGATYRAIADRFGLSIGHANNIVIGRKWKSNRERQGDP